MYISIILKFSQLLYHCKALLIIQNTLKSVLYQVSIKLKLIVYFLFFCILLYLFIHFISFHLLMYSLGTDVIPQVIICEPLKALMLLCRGNLSNTDVIV